ncbi:MAG: sigma-70 family RNA polymerase sigma factor [Pseudomonadales bacterium]
MTPAHQPNISEELRRLLSDHYRVLYEFALESLQDSAAAQDMVIHVLLEGGFEGIGKDTPANARKRLLGLARQQGLALPHLTESSSNVDIGIHAESGEDRGRAADVDVSTASNRDWLADCLRQLRPEDRQLLYLTHGAAMSQLEIAQMHSCSVEHISQRMAGVQNRVLSYLNRRSEAGTGDSHDQ